MEKTILKERFEYIIGFLALVISLNGFKDELKSIHINLRYFSFDLSQYFFIIILAVILCLHLYFVPYFITSESKIAIKTKGILIGLVYFILFLIVISPFAFGIIFLIVTYSNIAGRVLLIMINIIFGGIGGLAGGYAIRQVKLFYLKGKLKKYKALGRRMLLEGHEILKEFEDLKPTYSALKKSAIESGNEDIILDFQRLDKMMVDMEAAKREIESIKIEKFT